MKMLSNNFLNKWAAFWVFIFTVSVIAIPGHGGEAAIVLILTALYQFITGHEDRFQYNLNNDEKKFFIVILCFWLLNIFGAFFQPNGLEYENLRISLRSIDNPMRWLAMIPIFFLLRKHLIDWKIIAFGLSIGVLISVSIAFYQIYFLGIHRASGSMNDQITFGEIMVVVDLILWVLMILAWTNNNYKISALLLFSSLVAFYGSLLSVTRGAWLAYFILIFTFLFLALKRQKFNKKNIFSRPILFRIVLTFAVLFSVVQTEQYKTIQVRTGDTIIDALDGNYNAASGGRIPIYKTAIKIAKNFPFGVGTDNFRMGGKVVIAMDAIQNPYVVVKNQNGEIIETKILMDNLKSHLYFQSYNTDGSIRYTSRYRHAHNEWLNILAENGILGFILLTLIFGIPFKIFWKNIRDKNYLVSANSYCGLLVLGSFIIFGQTQSVFTSHAALMFFVFFVYFFLSQISLLKNNKQNNNGNI